MKQVSHTLNWLLAALIVLLWATRTFAAMPEALSYQGYLTDAAGTPLDSTVNIMFRLYNVSSGGTAAWSDTQTVPVSKGLFTVQLGSAGNPLPSGLFDNPVWLGIEVGTDGEMVPRKALTAVGFAFRAQQAENDADTLGGLNCATDQVAKWSGSAWTCAADLTTDPVTYNLVGNLHLSDSGISLDFGLLQLNIGIYNNGQPSISDFSMIIDVGDGKDIPYLSNILNTTHPVTLTITAPHNGLTITLDSTIIDRLQFSEDDTFYSQLAIFVNFTHIRVESDDGQNVTIADWNIQQRLLPSDCDLNSDYSNTGYIKGSVKYGQSNIDYGVVPVGISLTNIQSPFDVACYFAATVARTDQGNVNIYTENPVTHALVSTATLSSGVFFKNYTLVLSDISPVQDVLIDSGAVNIH